MYFSSSKAESKENIIRQKIQAAKDEIDRLTLEKQEAWNEIKDFRVSANKADQNYKRMSNMTLDIKKLNTEIKRLQKRLDG